MAIVRGGQQGSGVDRALGDALRAELDDILESGELYEGERDDFPEPYGPYDPMARPWQMPLATKRQPPAAAEALPEALRDRNKPAVDPPPARSRMPRVPPPPPVSAATREAAIRAKLAPGRRGAGRGSDADLVGDRARAEFRFRPELTGVVLIHGVGQQLAGETLLSWTRPMVALLADAARADADRPEAERRLKPLPPGPRSVTDPVFRASIDFSGQTFPVVQLRVPGRTDVPADDPRANERKWLVSETWWAAQVKPPTLGAMIEWLGDEGGLGRILQGIQENMLGRGLLGGAARVSLQALVSVVVAFALLFFAFLLGVTKLVPFGPLKDFVALRLAASWLTDGFGGARTLLRDPAQSANVRGRLVATIKALRAYGCRDIVVVGHSGGTMVSLQTLTDPAYPRLRIQKLITHGEALNLAWRLETEEQDLERPRLPAGHRMLGDMALDQPRMLWRDFWATHDPASSGPPVLPERMTDPGAPRFLAERVYNRMRISEDHNVFWNNDEHFLIPLIREIDTVSTDRSNSAFYSDAAESAVRARRKERVSLLAFWRRATLALPAMGILAALLLTAGGALPEAARIVLSAFASVPFHKELIAAGATLNGLGAAKIAPFLPDAFTWQRWYDLGAFAMQIIFMLVLALAVIPGRPDRLWLERPVARTILLAVDIAIGFGALGLIAVAWMATAGSHPNEPDFGAVVLGSGLPGLIGLGLALLGIGWLGKRVRATIRVLEPSEVFRDRLLRDALIVGSSVFLALVLVLVLATIVGVALVFAGNAAVARTDENRNLVLGSIAAVVAFQVIQALGIWRWDAWDARERRALRRRPLAYPFRKWAFSLAVALGVIAILGAVVVAAGPGWSPPLLARDGWLGTIVGLIAIVIIFSVGKDVVDNDVASGDDATIMPEAKGPPAGAAAS